MIENNGNNTFPSIIQIEATLLGFKLNLTLYQQTGFLQKSLNIKFYMKNSFNSTVNKSQSANTVEKL